MCVFGKFIQVALSSLALIFMEQLKFHSCFPVIQVNLVCHLVRERDENFTLQKAIMERLNQQLELLQAQNLNLTETVKQLAASGGT